MQTKGVLNHLKNLYSIEELFEGYQPDVEKSYESTFDWKTYNDYKNTCQQENSREDLLLGRRKQLQFSKEERIRQCTHDCFLEDEIEKYLESLQTSSYGACLGVIGIMGGHAIARSSRLYFEIAEIARQLTREKYLIVTGGSTGVMEAANLGAWLAPLEDAALPQAIKKLAIPGADTYQDDLWRKTAWELRSETVALYAKGERRSLSIPSWYYEQEATNFFATDIAKFFNNAWREEVLLRISECGLIFFEGGVSTVQEIFDAAGQNYHSYKEELRHLILFNEAYWNPKSDASGHFPQGRKPVWPLLLEVAQDGHFEHRIELVSSAIETLRTIKKIAANNRLNQR